MKQKTNARQKREAEALRRKGAFSPKTGEGAALPAPKPVKPAAAPKPAVRPKPTAAPLPAKTPEEETREFLDWLERWGVPVQKEEPPAGRRAGKQNGALPRLDLEAGMPTVSEALDRLNIGLQEMRAGRAAAVKLIHGYGSTGRGGKIGPAVRAELAAMKRRRQLRDYIPGEEFGPVDAASRQLADRLKTVSRDPDWGRMNHGITIAVL